MIIYGPFTFQARGVNGRGAVYRHFPGGHDCLSRGWESLGNVPEPEMVWGMNPIRHMQVLARLLLFCSGVGEPQIDHLWLPFAIQVLLHLPGDAWEMSAEEVAGWSQYHPLCLRITEYNERDGGGLAIRPTPN